MRFKKGFIGLVALIFIVLMNIGTVNGAGATSNINITTTDDGKLGKLYFPNKEGIKLYLGFTKDEDDEVIVNSFNIKNNSSAKLYLKVPENSYFVYSPLSEKSYYPIESGEDIFVKVRLNKTKINNEKKTYSAKLFEEVISVYSSENPESLINTEANNKLQMVLTVLDGFEVKATDVKIIEGEKAVISPKIHNGQAPFTYKIYSGDGTKEADILEQGITDKDIDAVTVKPAKDTKYTVSVTDRFGSSVKCEPTVYVEAATYKAEISKKEIDFGSTFEEYTSLPDEVSFVISNKGNQPITINEATNKNFDIKGITEKTKLGVDEYIVLKAVPKGGLSKGTYADTVKFTTDRNGVELSIKLYYKVNEKKQTISVSPTSVSFGNTTEGYSQIPSAKTVTVKNTGNTTVKVKVPLANYFEITGFTSDVELAEGKSISFTVAPKNGLEGKNYSESIKIESEKSSVNLTASFSVAKAPTVKVDGANAIKSGDSTTLRATVSGGRAPYKYKWSTGATTQSINVKPTEETDYSVTVVDATGITAEGKITVGVNTPVKVYIDGNLIVKSGESTTLTAVATEGVAPYKYSWSNGDTSDSIVCTPTGTESVKVTVTDSFGSSAVAYVTIKISEKAKKEVEDSFDIKADKDELDYGLVPNDYISSNNVKWVKISNYGNRTVSFQKPASASFEVSGIMSGTLLSAGSSFNISIAPKASLEAGSHAENITIRTEQGTSLDIKANIYVDDKPSPKPVKMKNETINESKEFEYGNGILNFIFEKDKEEDIVGIVDTAAVADTVLEAEDKKLIAEGNDSAIKVISQIMSASEVPEIDRQTIEDAIEQFRIKYPNIEIGKYIDISINKKIGDDVWKQVSELKDPIALQLTIPDDIREKGKNFYLFRLHEGVVEKVAEWSREDAQWQFSSDRFSTYVIAYTKVKAKSRIVNTEDTIKTNYMNMISVAIIVLVSIFIMLILYKINRKTRRKK